MNKLGGDVALMEAGVPAALDYPCIRCGQPIDGKAEKAWLDRNVPRLQGQVSCGVTGVGAGNWHSTDWQCVAATLIGTGR